MWDARSELPLYTLSPNHSDKVLLHYVYQNALFPDDHTTILSKSRLFARFFLSRIGESYELFYDKYANVWTILQVLCTAWGRENMLLSGGADKIVRAQRIDL